MGDFLGPKVYLIDELLKNLLHMNAHWRLTGLGWSTYMNSVQIILTAPEVLSLVCNVNNLGYFKILFPN